MKLCKRLTSVILLLCMILTMIPPVQLTQAAEVTYRYELDTDGIDAGATYLIVSSGSAGSANALRFYYESYWNRDFQNQTLTVKNDGDGVYYIETGFENEADCQFVFSAANAGTITCGDYYVNLSGSGYSTSAPSNTLTFNHQGNGAYSIYYTSWWYTYYLRYSDSNWARSTTSSTVYLYKQVEYSLGYDVTYDGNGYTAGTLPQNAGELTGGSTYTVLAPGEELRKDVGQDTYLFRCWNTAADGSGTEYAPGDSITVTEDVTLYAQWYQQTKYTVTMITDLDGVATDVDIISAEDKAFYVRLEGADTGYIPLYRTAAGTYSAKVADNGTYVVYSKVGDGAYEAVHGHKVVIYNQDGSTECLHYSVSYVTAGGSWAEGEAPAAVNYHANTAVTATDKVPVMEGSRFIGWMDQDGNLIASGAAVTGAISQKTVLTAQWEDTVDVTVNVYIDHVPQSDDGADRSDTKADVTLQVMRTDENGYNHQVGTLTLSADSHGGYTWQFDENSQTTSYIMPEGEATFSGLQKGTYTASVSKRQYEASVTNQTDGEGNVTITVNLQYAPTNFDLEFDVAVDDWQNVPEALRPEGVNIKVSSWGYNEDGELGWQIISQQEGQNPPTTVTLDPATGTGSGFYPVWKYWPSDDGVDHPYFYRITVSSYIMPDGTVAPAAEEDHTVYTAGIYQGTVSILPDGSVPDYPAGSEAQTSLTGTQCLPDSDSQDSTPTLHIRVTPFTVTFDAGEGTLNGEQTQVLEDQFRYPDISTYVPVPNDPEKLFVCWVENGEAAVNNPGAVLPGDVTYTARYNDNITLSGEVTVAASYQQDGQTVYVHDIDRAAQVLVVLQKKIGNIYNDLDSQAVDITYVENAEGVFTVGTGAYEFTNLPNDGTEYRVQVLALNYTEGYDNNGDGTYAETESSVIIDDMTARVQVDISLDFVPESYQQALRVDASRIAESLRPTDALVQLLYRDLGDVHHYQVISQHTVEPYGVPVRLQQSTAEGIGFYDVWNWHTDGTLYEYQLQLSKLYGNVEGAYTADGTAYSSDSPYTVVYGPSNNYIQQTANSGVMLEATLIPREYLIVFDMNMDSDDAVLGMKEFMVDDGTGEDRYVYMHTWSYADAFTAFPYREGYVFKGWVSSDEGVLVIDDGNIHVGATVAETVTLTAQWEQLSGTDYTIRHLELNTDRVLHGAQAVTGATAGSSVVAANAALSIEGYVYAGATVDGTYYDKTANPAMVITDDPLENLLVVYYLPDGSDGYTEQVESNLDLNKTAVLEDNGTYTITLDTYTKDNPITTLIEQNTPLDIVLVLDQSGSMAANDYEYLNALQDAVDDFVESVADHGRHNEVDHRIAVVGYASNETDGHSDDPVKATGGKETDTWVNTGVFDSNGEFHLYNVNGFNYTELTDTSTMTADGIYYTKVEVDGQARYLLLTHHDEYRHLITEEEARVALLDGETIYGYVYDSADVGSFVELTRNTSGLWLYGDKQLYSAQEFFTYHTDVWTHRDDIEPRQIHAYGVGTNYAPTDGHEGVYTREETTDTSFEQSIYADALIPVSIGANGSGGTNPGLIKATQSLGADGATRASYGMQMANQILAAAPVDEGEERVRIVVMFTDGEPGFSGFSTSSSSNYDQAVEEANSAIAQANIAKNTYGAYVYSVGLYESAGVDAASDVAYYMNALSSNYPTAQSMDDIKADVSYTTAADGTALVSNSKYYVKYNNTYYQIKYGYVRISNRSQYCWYYTRGNTNYSISTATSPTVSGGKVGSYTIYEATGGYLATDNSGYYSTTDSADQLKAYFEDILQDITTKVTTEIILESDTILRDIMNQGLVLTDGTVITVYTQEGNYDQNTGSIVWAVDENGEPVLEEKVSLSVGSGETSARDEESGVAIYTYNLDAQNPTDPDGEDYHPHTVDITGYNFSEWFISQEHTTGYKMVVTITCVEATDGVQWGRSTATNNEQSGLWLPADENGYRELLLPFEQPTTIFVERAYVLDYGKEFTLSGWYFDDEDGKDAEAVHVDCDISNGMNWFDPSAPNTSNGIGSEYGNTRYGNVSVADGKVTYTPVSMSWGGYDQFYVFGDTWRKTVLAQDANENGNLWNKVTVIPANNIYYEDSFVTTEDTAVNGIEGFTFTGTWQTVSDASAGQNTEIPEHLESALYGDVHGWTDSLGDDTRFTDGSAHATGLNGEMGAMAEFTFTGTGVDVYTRTNADSGMVVAVLSRKTENADGSECTQLVKSIAMDNLAVSGDYYHIPTVSFEQLVYGTYTVKLIATAASTATAEKRYEYYIDGVRVYNPLGSTTNYASDTVKDAYGLETNAVFTEVRDVLLDYEDFNADMTDSTGGKLGAVFIDWIQDGQQSGNDQAGIGVPTYEIGTFETYGPKNEVYLSAGQAIVLKVDPNNTYYVGLKSLTGGQVTANVSGITRADPVKINLSHTTDMYYQVTPVNGYIVIQNGASDGSILSVTKLRTTNLYAPAADGGIQPVAQQEAVAFMSLFSRRLAQTQEENNSDTRPSDPTEETSSDPQQQAEANLLLAQALFGSVRTWLHAE